MMFPLWIDCPPTCACVRVVYACGIDEAVVRCLTAV